MGRARVEVESEGLRVSAFASLAGRAFELRAQAHAVPGHFWIEVGTAVELLGRRGDGVVVRAHTGWRSPADLEATVSCEGVVYDSWQVAAPVELGPFVGTTAHGPLSLARTPGGEPFAILRSDTFRLVVVHEAGAHVRVRSEHGAVGFDAWVPASEIGPTSHSSRVGYPRSATWGVARRRGFVGERAEDERAEQPAPSALEACMRARGTLARMETAASEPEPDAPAHSEKSTWAAEVGGFDVHAGVTVDAGDREGLERLCRYGGRPPFSLERLSLLPDGRVAYRLRKPRRDGATHLILTPIQFVAKLAALVPPPRYPLTRFAGVLAPGSSLRARVVAHRPHRSATAPAAVEPSKPMRPKKRKKKGEPAADPPPTRAPQTSLGAGVVPPCYARIDWASLLRRVYLVDVLSCPCGGRRALVADVTDPGTIAAILAHLGLATEPPPIARARDPTSDAA